ncbi:class A beta-lactamase-related serine hydrolase [Flagellimonas lutimaris]|uniref:Class A beta-lactamase-related serine hydrolase n=1 Tax=Flagellimonas lutimaris TaxID=475082 RepID=A0A3A1NBU9_9FLAO|nr:serine hydrolase domain-containing protein [Allomuricauda lutimaris]RIV36711.1 class A beta-lactamase-related serine hydrolase [Allomuricauda lutimaris]
MNTIFKKGLPLFQKPLYLLLTTLCVSSCKNLGVTPQHERVTYKVTAKTERLSKFVASSKDAIAIIPGVSVAVVDENGPLFMKSIGYADMEKETRVNDQTAFYIASCTKSFNGLLANLLEEEGILKLSENITVYAPFKNFNDKTVFEEVTIMDLLSHQSGLSNPYLTFRLAYSGQYDASTILSLIEDETVKSEEGKIFSYTNLGYYFLDAIMKAETGKSWKELLEEKVLKPLEMDNTTAYMSALDKENYAFPHLGGHPDSIYRAPILKTDETMHPAGGLVSNVEDVSKFLTIYINKGSHQGSQIFSQELIERTYKKQVDTKNTIGNAFDAHGYGSGWLLGKHMNEDLVVHYGAYEGYRAHISFIPEKKIGVVVFINHELAMQFINQIVKFTYHLYLDNEMDTFDQEAKINEELTDLLHRYQKYLGERKQKLSEAAWNLSRPKSDYTGVFTNENLGTLEIKQHQDKLVISCGNLKGNAIPHPDSDCTYVQLASQSGESICFQKKDNRITGLQYRGEDFTKTTMVNER